MVSWWVTSLPLMASMHFISYSVRFYCSVSFTWENLKRIKENPREHLKRIKIKCQEDCW